MRTLVWGKPFVRALRRTIKKHPTLNKEITETLKILVEDPFSPQLETHKLKGKLSGSWACTIGYDLRIVFDFIKSEQQKDDEVFKPLL